VSLRIRNDLCMGCGLCADNCPERAISILQGYAEINHSRCTECGLCLEFCPEGAIVKWTLVSKQELQATVTSLKEKTVELMERIEKLKKDNSEVPIVEDC